MNSNIQTDYFDIGYNEAWNGIPVEGFDISLNDDQITDWIAGWKQAEQDMKELFLS